MPDDKFKLPVSSYEELVKVIIAYGQAGTGGASLDQIATTSTIGRTRISGNNTFLVGSGIVEGGNRKSITPPGDRLAHALMHDVSDEIQGCWRTIVEENEFLTKMALAVRIRKQMDTNTLVSHIAYSSGEKKSKVAMTGARAIADILRVSGMVREEDGLIVPETSSPPPRYRSKDESPPPEPDEERVVLTQQVNRASGRINIQVNIEATPADLDGLGAKLRTLLDELDHPDNIDAE